MTSNYYQILGVTKNATKDQIKVAYRRLAREFHPDVAQSDRSEEQFKEINRAYDILSDPLKRADFDATLEPQPQAQTRQAPQPGTEEAYAWQPSEAPREETASSTSRVSATIVVFLIVGAIIEFGLRWLMPDNPLSETNLFFVGLVASIIAGVLWGVDNNFDMEGVLGPRASGRYYTFLRSLVYTLVPVYFLSLIGTYIDYFLYQQITYLTPILGMIGAMIGATLGSNGDSPIRLTTKEGRFELFCIFLRGIEVGLMGAVVGGILGLIFLRSGYPIGLTIWGIYFGFILGMIAGSISPPNLSAYASYVSASLKNVILGIIVAGALILGIIVGGVFSEQLSQVFGIIWESLIKIIGG
jgi:hypothetical protein